MVCTGCAASSTTTVERANDRDRQLLLMDGPQQVVEQPKLVVAEVRKEAEAHRRVYVPAEHTQADAHEAEVAGLALGGRVR